MCVACAQNCKKNNVIQWFVSYFERCVCIFFLVQSRGLICCFTADTCSKFSHLEGRRFVDIRIRNFTFRLKGWTVCQHRLRLSNCYGKKIYGLAVVLEIKCSTCGVLAKIGTSDTHTPAGDSNRSRQPCDVNAKAAFATKVRGIGITQANLLFAVLNILQMAYRNSKKREHEVGAIVERLQSKVVRGLVPINATWLAHQINLLSPKTPEPCQQRDW